MKGTMRKRKRDVWEITVECGKDAQGKRRRRSYTVRGTKAVSRTPAAGVGEKSRKRDPVRQSRR